MRISQIALDWHTAVNPRLSDAAEKRRKEFAAGRYCAWLALLHLGKESDPLPRNNSGAAKWPEGFTGTITHTDTWCAAAAARTETLQSIGLDIEHIPRMNDNIAARVLTYDEQRWIDLRPKNEKAQWQTLVFSAKESFYKCLHPVIHDWIGFEEVRITPDPEKRTLQFMLNDRLRQMPLPEKPFSGRFLLDGDLAMACVFLPA
jgi:phosphopantetheine--protein transferase-like protein